MFKSNHQKKIRKLHNALVTLLPVTHDQLPNRRHAIYWYNGKLIQSNTIELAIDEPGVLYGATVFTTLRVYQRSLTHPLTNWQAHCDRLRQSIEFFGWQQPNWQQLQHGAATLSEYPILRITLFPDGREWITTRSLPNDLTKKQKHGIKAYLSPEELRRSLPGHKTGNYLAAWFAKTTAQQFAAAEAILIDENGNWLETSTGNLWGWRDNCWWTPPLSAGILPGIARSQILEWIKNNNQHVKEEPWLAEAVDCFEAIAYSNSVVEIVPIHTVIERQNVEQIVLRKYDPYHSSLKLLRQLYVA